MNPAGHNNLTMNCLRTFLSLAFLLLTFQAAARADEIEITGPELKHENNQIRVTAALSLNKKSLEELQNGISKEMTFTVDLFRIWRMWPDEFISGKKFVRVLKSDPIKMEYNVSSHDGSTLIRKKFKSFDSMIQWALLIEDLKLANTDELEASAYYVRVTVESRIRKLPPVIGYFMIFLPEYEFRIRKDSAHFTAGTRQ